jgi:ABC-2 type transport system permease protein
VENELLRVLRTVQPTAPKKRLGIIRTQALDWLEAATDANSPEKQFLDTLGVFYDVAIIDLAKSNKAEVDVLLVLQPSSISPDLFDRFVGMVEGGTPTAIFEDPLPSGWGVPGTEYHPKNAPFAQPAPKAELTKLWKALGVELVRSGAARPGAPPSPVVAVWQQPDRDVAEIFSDRHFVFVRRGRAPSAGLHPTAAATHGLTCLLFPIAGALGQQPGTPTKFTPLVTTSKESGLSELSSEANLNGTLNVKPGKQISADGSQVLAAEVVGNRPAASAAATAERGMHAIVVADLDCIAPLQLTDISRFCGRLGVDNSVFLFRILDALAGDTRWSDVRGRRLEFPPATEADEQARREQAQALADCQRQEEEVGRQIRSDFEAEIEKIKNQKIDAPALEQEMQRAMVSAQARLEDGIRALREQRDNKVSEITRRARNNSPGMQSTMSLKP